MNKVTFFSTSKPVIDKKTDTYPNIISSSIESELREVDSDAILNLGDATDLSVRIYFA